MDLRRGRRKKPAEVETAILESEAGLQEAQRRQDKVDKLVDSLKHHGDRNHFAEMLEIAFGRTHP